MHSALNKTLAALPDDTKVYVCSQQLFLHTWLIRQAGHEYTKSNVKFLTKVLDNESVKQLQSFAENNQQTQGKFTIGDEKVGCQYFLLGIKGLTSL